MSTSTTITTSTGAKVRVRSIRRYVVTTPDGTVVRRTDSATTAAAVAAKTRHGEVHDTAPVPADRTCVICRSRAQVNALDFAEFNGRHWHCVPEPERQAISAAHRAGTA